MNRKRKHFASLITLAAAMASITATKGAIAAGPETSAQPTGDVSPATKPTYESVLQQAMDVNKERSKLIGDGSVLRDPSRRAELREKLISLQQQNDALTARMQALKPSVHAGSPQEAARDEAGRRLYLNALMVAVEDPATTAKVQSQIASGDPTLAAIGHLTLLQGQWQSAPDDGSRQKVSDAIIEFLKTANAEDSKLAAAISSGFIMSNRACDDKLREAIVTAYPNVRVSNAAAAYKSFQSQFAKAGAYVNKPMVLAGPTGDGKPFTTADWKGKVILVDFWATWCGPCKASLPHVKELYQKYHGQGLEIVGVSNDRSKEALEKFLAADPAMAWPDLFDAKAAQAGGWNPIAKQYGVDAIPRMFLIDRNGICRTVEARTNMDEMIPKLLAEATPSAAAN